MATPAAAFAQLAAECEADGMTSKNAERIGTELARMFGVQAHEVAVLRVQSQNLLFSYPVKLRSVGSIPLNTVGSVAARTATSKRAEIINNFAQTKHTSVFEAVDLDGRQRTQSMTGGQEPPLHIIQKLMSVPVVSGEGVVGVIQVSRKGLSGPASGPDFTAADLQKLVAAAGALAKCLR